MRPGTEVIFCPIFSYSVGSKIRMILVYMYLPGLTEKAMLFFMYANNVRYETAIRRDLTIRFVTI